MGVGMPEEESVEQAEDDVMRERPPAASRRPSESRRRHARLAVRAARMTDTPERRPLERYAFATARGEATDGCQTGLHRCPRQAAALLGRAVGSKLANPSRATPQADASPWTIPVGRVGGGTC